MDGGRAASASSGAAAEDESDVVATAAVDRAASAPPADAAPPLLPPRLAPLPEPSLRSATALGLISSEASVSSGFRRLQGKYIKLV